eukprot:89198-Amphidinium_carterae.1
MRSLGRKLLARKQRSISRCRSGNTSASTNPIACKSRITLESCLGVRPGSSCMICCRSHQGKVA